VTRGAVADTPSPVRSDDAVSSEGGGTRLLRVRYVNMVCLDDAAEPGGW